MIENWVGIGTEFSSDKGGCPGLLVFLRKHGAAGMFGCTWSVLGTFELWRTCVFLLLPRVRR